MDAVVIAFASGKGGTGKSSATALVGAELSLRNKKVLIIEVAVSLRNIDVMTGTSKDIVYDLNDVLTGRCAPYKAIVRSKDFQNLFVISAPYSGGSIPIDTMQLLVKKMQPYFDYILLDVASGVGAAQIAAANSAHRFILVVTPDPLVLRDARFVMDSLPENVQTHLLINKVPQEGLQQDSDLASLDDVIDSVAVQLIGVVPNGQNIFAAGSSGKLLPDASLEKEVYAAIAARIEGEDIPLVFGL